MGKAPNSRPAQTPYVMPAISSSADIPITAAMLSQIAGMQSEKRRSQNHLIILVINLLVDIQTLQ